MDKKIGIKISLFLTAIVAVLLIGNFKAPNKTSETELNSDREVAVEKVEGYGIFIDSNSICVVRSHDDAEKLVDDLITKAETYYGVKNGSSVLNSIEISKGEYTNNSFSTFEEASRLMGTDGLFGEPSVALLNGERLVISLSEVSLVQKYVETEFETEYKLTYGVDKTYEKVLSEGENGVVKQLYETTEVDGEVVFQKMVLDAVVTEPKNRVVEIGVTPPMQLLSADLAFFIKPYDGDVTSRYGYRYLNGYEFHTGIDLANYSESCYGDNVVAAADGVVVEAGYTSGKGNYVVIKHSYGFSTLYAHFKDVLVSVGDEVKAGDPVGTIGVSGRVTGPHLHFEIRLNGAHTNPENYLKFE